MKHLLFAVLILGVLVVVACRQDMHDQPKYKPLAQSNFFGDDRASRSIVADTVARGHLVDYTEAYTGKTKDGHPLDHFPFPITAEIMKRGQQRYNIYCSPCHDHTGHGLGMVVRRGYRRPPTFYIDRLMKESPGYFYDVITNGFGAMPDYSAQIKAQDRWAIIAYIKALQYSESASINDVPEAERSKLK